MYTVVDDDQVLDQVAALPPDALTAFAEVRVLLEVAPWSGDPYREEYPDGAMRSLAFGASGIIVYLIMERDRVVHPLLVQWIG